LAQVDIIVSAIFADISGSAVGDAASIGGVLIPQMIRRGYPPRFAAAVQAAGGTLGLLFPPATSLIVYSSVTNVPISSLFAAAIVPGLIVTGAFMTVNVVMSRRLSLAAEARFAAAAIPRALASATLPLFAIVIIIGGILGGIFTPTESGVVAIAYSLLVALLATRSLRWRALPDLLTEASINGRDRGSGFRDCITKNYPKLKLLEIPTKAWSGEDAAAILLRSASGFAANSSAALAMLRCIDPNTMPWKGLINHQYACPAMPRGWNKARWRRRG